ncbi:MAG: bifunctional precorrin-2 dehydrogenase/sirohydrochlorin ferrochelatase [Acidobacteriota bacterium]|nr:bifunctional precorrin-2 dehydrogenase/sirohydrochlorin ferrochelatase [Acidobacteriota bacterium]
MLPLAFKLEGADCLVLGAGNVGAYKARQLLDAGARVHVISTEVLGVLPEGLASLRVRPYQRGDLAGYALVVSATADGPVNDQVVAEARERRVWLNVVDDLERSTFYFMALVRRGEVCVAVSTEGASPALAQELRDRVATVVPTSAAGAARALRAERRRLHDVGETTEGRDWRGLVRRLLDGEGV